MEPGQPGVKLGLLALYYSIRFSAKDPGFFRFLIIFRVSADLGPQLTELLSDPLILAYLTKPGANQVSLVFCLVLLVLK